MKRIILSLIVVSLFAGASFLYSADVQIPGTLSGGEGPADANTLRVTIAENVPGRPLIVSEDAGHISGDSGIPMWAVRVDTPASLADLNLDYAPLQVTATGELRVDASGLIQIEDVGHVDGAAGVFHLAIRNEGITPLTGANLDYSGVAVTREGFTMNVPVISPNLVGTVQLLKLEDTAHVTGDVGIPMWAVQQDSDGVSTAADGDYAALYVDSRGFLKVEIFTGGDTFVVSDGGGSLTVDGTVTAALSTGTLDANSPTTEVAILSLFDGSAESSIAVGSLGASKSISITGSGRITKICLISSLGSVHAQAGTLFFFDADPSIAINTDADAFTVAQAQTVVVAPEFTAAGYISPTLMALVAMNCQTVDEPFHSISHVVYFNSAIGGLTFDDEDMELHLWYRRDS